MEPMAVERGQKLVYSKCSPGSRIVFFSPKVDLTKDTIEAYNKKYPAGDSGEKGKKKQ